MAELALDADRRYFFTDGQETLNPKRQTGRRKAG
jgi:hypothetical protein